MVLHVIIDPGKNCIIFYANKKEKIVNSPKIKCFPLNSIDDIFKKIKLSLDIGFQNETFGCAFICLDDCIDSEIRKHFLECAKNCGFVFSKIIDKATAFFIKTIYNSLETLKHKNVIWIFDGFKSYVWIKKAKTFTLLSKLDKEVDGEIFKNLKKHFHYTTVSVYCDSRVKNIINKLFDGREFLDFGMKFVFPTADSSYVCPEMDVKTFIKININGKIDDYCIPELLIHRKIIIKCNSQTIYISGKYLDLPFNQLLNLKNDMTNIYVVELIEYDKIIQKQTFKSCKAINFNINENGICSFVSMNDGRSDEMDQEKQAQNLCSKAETIPSFSTQLNIPPEGLNLERKSSLQSPETPKMSNWMSPFRNPESKLFIPSDPQSTPTLSLTTYNIPPKVEIFKKNVNAIGIDLGTSRCCVAVSRTHSFETVGIENNGDRLMPSYISFIDKDVPQCGQIVVDQLKYAAKSTIFDSKRLIGKEFEYIDPDPAWPFELANIDGMAGFQIQSKNGSMFLTPEEVSAVLLKHIKKEVEKFQGKILSKAVITIPAAFTESQKQITIKAAKMAEWSPRLLPEPIAAAFAYFNNHEYEENSTLLLFDLGGGTLDICLFKVINNSISIINQSGDSFLGGRDFDNLLFNYFYDRLEHEFGIIVRNDEKKKYKLLAECQKIKQYLSVRNEERLDVDEFTPDNGNTILITRKMFEEKAKPLLFKIRTFITTILKESGYQSSQISKILLVGGGCRMPMIKELLKNKFPDAKQCCEEQPEEVVAVGAAMYAYHLMTTK